MNSLPRGSVRVSTKGGEGRTVPDYSVCVSKYLFLPSLSVQVDGSKLFASMGFLDFWLCLVFLAGRTTGNHREKRKSSVSQASFL
jgi:hypothetical protein